VPHGLELGESQAVGLVEEVPGFAVVVVGAGDGAAFGAEKEAGLAVDVGEGEDEPGVFRDDVGDDEVDFGEFVGDGASVDAAVGVDVVEAVLKLSGGLNLDADEAGAGVGVGRGGGRGGQVGGVEDDVVAFAVAEGFGDAEAVAGGGEGEGEFGDLAAAFGGEFAPEGSERLGSLWGAGWSGRGFRATLGASANGAF